ncbi:hypothetical protein ARMGADRAFT_1000330 [Armillaria gallica]|uniref:NACHT domain-containing protein n=1 Tax=Armillaria gallica TaxID=47427 RepID=A0A2H3D0S9_ARMGA|nr:hypothetical protein ARMGADRAFT_1000330 [Armillaria gallica]
MDPFSVITTIPDIIERCMQAYDIIKAIKNAPKSCSELMEELATANVRLNELQMHIEEVKDQENPQLDAALHKYKTTLESILNEFRGGKLACWTRIKWALSREKTVKELTSELRQNAAIFQPLLISISKRLHALQRNQNENVADKRIRNVIAWLKPLDPSTKQQLTSQLRQPQTCGWLPSHRQFTSWFSSGSFLWLNGTPGSGKTVLASFAIEYLKENMASEEIVLFVFVDFRDVRSTNLVAVMRTLLAQLLSGYNPKDFVKDFADLYKSMRDGTEPPSSFEYLTQLLKRASASWKRVFIVVDALDECALTKRRESIAEVRKLASAGSKFSIFVTSREEQDIVDVLNGIPTICLGNEMQSVNADIERFVKDKMNAPYLSLVRLDAPLRHHITSTLLEKSNGMFRLVDCQLDSLAKAKFKKNINNILRNLPDDLNSMYERILQGVEAEEKRAGADGKNIVSTVRRTLWWLVGSRRGLHLAELREAIMVEKERYSPNEDFELMSDEHLLDICSSLVHYDTETDLLVLSHFSVQEFILSGHLKDTKYAVYHAPSVSFLYRHITGLIMAYLQYADFHTGPCKNWDLLSERLNQHPLLVYIASYWDWHITRMDEATPDEQPSDKEVLDLLFDTSFLPIQRSLRQISYFGVDVDVAAHDASLCELDDASGFFGPRKCYGPPWLAVEAHCNYQLLKQSPPNTTSIAEENYMVYPLLLQGPTWLIQKIMKRRLGLIDRPLFAFGTPLMICVYANRVDMMEMLLKEGANANTCAPHYHCDHLIVPPIFLAVKAVGNAEMVKILLKYGSNTVFPGQQPDDGIPYTIIAAAEYGRPDVLKALIDYGDDVNTRSVYNGHTVLYAAVMAGSMDCIIVLANAGCRIAGSSRVEGRTPLQVALELQSSTIVRYLLSQGALPHECWYLSLDSIHWAMGEDWYPEMQTCLVQLESKQLVEANCSRKDVEEVAHILKLRFRLPILLTQKIFDFAEFWIAVSCERHEKVMIEQDSPDEPYVSTPPIGGRLENSVRRIVFRTSSHDQGWSSDGYTLGVYSGSFTWFEAEVDSARGVRRQILRNARADPRSRTHTRDQFSSSDTWMANIKSGDSISVYPKALYGGWVNYVESISVMVFTTCF